MALAANLANDRTLSVGLPKQRAGRSGFPDVDASLEKRSDASVGRQYTGDRGLDQGSARAFLRMGPQSSLGKTTFQTPLESARRAGGGRY